MNFLFIIYFLGLLIATIQDFKRREIDDWLNLLLFFSGFIFLIYSLNDYSKLLYYSFFIFFMFLVSYGLYFARFFSGGDAKLLFAMTPLFLGAGFVESSTNLLAFIFVFIILGALYGLLFILFKFFSNFELCKKEFMRYIKKKISLIIILCALLIFVFGFFFNILFFFSILIFVFLLLYYLAKSSEKTFIRSVYSRDLTEGEWLAEEFSFKNKKFSFSWEGLSPQNINFLKKYKKRITIKDGIPFAFVFLSTFIFYFLLRVDWTFFIERFLNHLI